MEEIAEILMRNCEREVREFYEKRDKDIDYILRNKIKNPIKGEITAGKLRWRGIKSIAFGPGREFLGIIQRGKVIRVDG